VKHGYEETAQMEQAQYGLAVVEHQQMERALKAVYAVALHKDDGHGTTANVFVHGTDLQLRTMNLQEGYQARVTKIKITVQVELRVCSRAPLLLFLTPTPTHPGLLLCIVRPNLSAAQWHLPFSAAATGNEVPGWH
jgi:hypothetical protein